MMLYELDDLEKRALMGVVVDRARADLNDGKPLVEMAHKSNCDCPLHQLTREQLIDRIDAAIDAVNAEVRANGGVLPAEPRPGERIQTWFCEDCQTQHTGSVLGGLIGDPHGETK